ncbi:Uma2 family endonuclease [Allokutzneria oryzae]|uniref:Uma2 family endonuclease n=1 Tax=Allokutzneria oryzae TaxID=1378989 RepID=A0ABV5ZW07_9PSEU
MTTPPRPDRLLTIDQYAALGETEYGYAELQEGRLVRSPSPTPDHNVVVGGLRDCLRPGVPDGHELIQDVHVDLELAPAGRPGSVRRPDLVVVDRAARRRVRSSGGMIRASEIILVVEVLSPDSHRTDSVFKRHDYADAGIPHYWIVDLQDRLSLVAYSLTMPSGYLETAPVRGEFTATEPFPVRIDLDWLLGDEDV